MGIIFINVDRIIIVSQTTIPWFSETQDMGCARHRFEKHMVGNSGCYSTVRLASKISQTVYFLAAVPVSWTKTNPFF